MSATNGIRVLDLTGDRSPTDAFPLPRAPAAAPVAPNTAPSNSLKIPMDPGETPDGMRAKTVLRPTMRAAQTIAGLDKCVGDLDLTTLVGKLGEQVSAVQGGDLGRAEEMLVAQAHTLDLLFNQLVFRSMNNLGTGYHEAGETYMRLALRTQSQCRATLETLAVVKNPPSVSFVRQANIANGPQQVNNGGASSQPALPRVRENQQSQLLEKHGDEWLEPGTAQAAIGSDSALAAVGALNGAAHDGG